MRPLTMTLITLLVGCSSGVELEDTVYPCDSNADCVPGWVCEHSESAGEMVCLREFQKPLGPQCEPACEAGELCVADGLCQDANGLFHKVGPDRDAEMASIPAGEYTLGCNPGTACVDTPCCDSTSSPQVTVTLSATAYVDRFEVTNQQFEAYLAANAAAPVPSCQPAPSPDEVLWDENSRTLKMAFRDWAQHPVVCVSALDADAYCKWANKVLPTEALWEAGARGTYAHYAYPWGPDFDSDFAQCFPASTQQGDSNYCWNSYLPATPCGNSNGTCERTGPVTIDGLPTMQDGVSPMGLFHMAGNAAEWVADGWTPDHTSCADGCSDPFESPTSGGLRVTRGGSWDSLGKGLAGGIDQGIMTWTREAKEGSARLVTVGFRCAY